MRSRTLSVAGAALLATGLLTAAPATAAPPHCQGEPATLVGTKGKDTLRGTDGRDVIVGLGGRDRIFGRGGDDLICGNSGADFIRGNRGADSLRGNLSGDTVLGNLGGDDLAGDLGDDVLEGGWGPDDLDGGQGRLDYNRAGAFVHPDLLRGGPGNDRLDPGVDDRDAWSVERISYDEASGPVRVDAAARTVTGEGADTYPGEGVIAIVGSPHDDEMVGSSGHDIFIGAGGDDLLVGNGGEDWLTGKAGSDLIRGGDGPDDLHGGADVDRVHGGPGDDALHDFAKGPDKLYGNGGDDYVDDRMNFGNGHVVVGGEGNDYLQLNTDRTGRDAHRPGRTDMRAGTTVVFERPRIHARTAGFESLQLPEAPWTYLGTGGDDQVTAGGFISDTARWPVTFRGRGGDDYFEGSQRGDRYFGGSGHDGVNDWGGNDLCRSIESELRKGKICDR